MFSLRGRSIRALLRGPNHVLCSVTGSAQHGCATRDGDGRDSHHIWIGPFLSQTTLPLRRSDSESTHIVGASKRRSARDRTISNADEGSLGHVGRRQSGKSDQIALTDGADRFSSQRSVRLCVRPAVAVPV